MKKTFKRMILICFFIILILTILIIVLKTNNGNNKTEDINETLEPPQQIGLTKDMPSEVNIEYKNIAKLNTVTGGLIESTQFIEELEDFIVYDMQDCINKTSEDNIKSYYDTNSNIFNRQLFTVSESSFENMYLYLVNLKQSIAGSCTSFDFSELDENSVKISLTFKVDDTDGVLEGTVKKGEDGVVEVIF